MARSLRICRLAWPPCLFVFSFATAMVSLAMGYRAFLQVHFWVEIAMLISVWSGTIHAARLWDAKTAGMPRWVFYANLLPVLTFLVAIASVIFKNGSK